MSERQLLQIINWEHVESLKVTSDTTVYVRFTSGEGTIYEFQNPEKIEDMMMAYVAWCSTSNCKAYVIYQEQK